MTERGALKVAGAVRARDYSGNHLIRKAGLPPQPLPDWMRRGSDESLAAYRDRLCQQFRIPMILAALSQIKCAYVEVLNPLLSRRTLAAVQTMPDSLRNDKALVSRQIRSLGPPVPFAATESTPAPEVYLTEPDMVHELLNELSTAPEGPGSLRESLPQPDAGRAERRPRARVHGASGVGSGSSRSCRTVPWGW